MAMTTIAECNEHITRLNALLASKEAGGNVGATFKDLQDSLDRWYKIRLSLQPPSIDAIDVTGIGDDGVDNREYPADEVDDGTFRIVYRS